MDAAWTAYAIQGAVGVAVFVVGFVLVRVRYREGDRDRAAADPGLD